MNVFFLFLVEIQNCLLNAINLLLNFCHHMRIDLLAVLDKPNFLALLIFFLVVPVFLHSGGLTNLNFDLSTERCMQMVTRARDLLDHGIEPVLTDFMEILKVGFHGMNPVFMAFKLRVSAFLDLYLHISRFLQLRLNHVNKSGLSFDHFLV